MIARKLLALAGEGLFAAVALAALGLLAAILFLAGCAAPVDRDAPELRDVGASPEVPSALAPAHSWTIVLDPNVPPPRAEAVRSAARAWEAAFPCPATILVVAGPTERMSAGAPAPGTIEVRMDDDLPEADATGYGLWWPNGGARVAFRPGASDEDFPRVALHELGHALRLPHDDREPSLMASSGARYREIMPADALALAPIWCASAP